MRDAVKTLRWLLVVPAGILAWYAVFIAVLFTYPIVEQVLCPPGDWISRTCMNSTVSQWMKAFVLVHAGLSAVAVVVSAVAVAPSHKRVIAWLAFGAGALVALSFALAARATGEAIVAIAMGLPTAYLLARRYPDGDETKNT